MPQLGQQISSILQNTVPFRFPDWMLKQVQRLPTGQIVSKELVRKVEGKLPVPQFVPHFGCVCLDAGAGLQARSTASTALQTPCSMPCIPRNWPCRHAAVHFQCLPSYPMQPKELGHMLRVVDPEA